MPQLVVVIFGIALMLLELWKAFKEARNT